MWIDLIKISDMVSVVRRGLVERGDPQRGDAKVDEIRYFFDDAFDSSSKKNWLVPVFCVLKTSEPIDEDMVDSTLFHPVYMTHLT
jgi:hypothetical protein